MTTSPIVDSILAKNFSSNYQPGFLELHLNLIFDAIKTDSMAVKTKL
jgi:hypothetical protein